MSIEPITCTTWEAVEATGLTRTSLFDAIKNGRIQSVKVGRRRLIVVASLREFLGIAA